jgi:hypothetical protein
LSTGLEAPAAAAPRHFLPHPMTIALAFAAGVGWLGFPGLLWDVAWHRTVGRDSFLSPPHVLMYAGVAANGAVAAWALRARATRLPGLVLSGAGFALTLAGAVLDEAWHRLIGKDVNLWSPPHLVGLAGTVLIALGLLLAVAAHTRYAVAADGRALRAVLLLFFADLVHKGMVALDHYTLDPWGRTPDFYPFLLALFLPVILVAARRAVGPGGAAGTAAAFMAQHALILGVLLAAGMKVPTFSPFPLLPALAVEIALLGRTGAAAAALAGVACALVTALQEAAWMAWVVERPWAADAVLAQGPVLAVTGAGSAWVGWTLGAFVLAAGSGRPVADLLGGRRRRGAALAVMLALTAAGLVAAYRPSRMEPPATVASLGLRGGADFDYRDAVFWEAILPDDWRSPGRHETYQEGIVDGRPFPLGPAWCAPDDAALERELPLVRFELHVNGEGVPLAGYPATRLRTADGAVCHWIGLLATTPRPGRQTLRYDVHYLGPVPRLGVTGPAATTVVIDLAVKEP